MDEIGSLWLREAGVRVDSMRLARSRRACCARNVDEGAAAGLGVVDPPPRVGTGDEAAALAPLARGLLRICVCVRVRTCFHCFERRGRVYIGQK